MIKWNKINDQILFTVLYGYDDIIIKFEYFRNEWDNSCNESWSDNIIALGLLVYIFVICNGWKE